jgi:hypothetical protein
MAAPRKEEEEVVQIKNALLHVLLVMGNDDNDAQQQFGALDDLRLIATSNEGEDIMRQAEQRFEAGQTFPAQEGLLSPTTTAVSTSTKRDIRVTNKIARDSRKL